MKIAFLTTDNRESHRAYQLPSPYFGTAPTALLEGFSLGSGLEIHVISCTQRKMSSPAKLADHIWFHSLLVPKWGWLRSGYAGCIAAVRSKLRQIEPDVVHAQGTERDCAISSVLFPGPKLLTIHGNCSAISRLKDSRPFSYWWLQARLERFCLPRFDGVVCISKYTQRLVSDLARKTWLLPNAVESAFFSVPTKKSSSVPVVLVVANVDARKNQIGLIRSLETLSNRRPFEIRFFGMCGEDAYGELFRQLVKSKSWCSYGGMLDRDKLREEFAGAAAVMLPTWEDNCPMVVLEAQAAGIPVIASQVGGVPDLVENDVTGILTDPSKPETMPQALDRLLDHSEFAQRLVAQGRIQAKARFHPKVIAQRHLEIYHEVMASR